MNCKLDLLDQYLGYYRREGYLIIDDVIDSLEADKILYQIEKLSCSLCEQYKFKVKDTGYLTLVNNKRSAAGAIFNAVNKSPALNRFLFSVKFQRAAEILLNTEFVLAPPRQMNLRTDHPYETKHMYPWHCDYAYNGSSKNSLVFWVPLTAVDELLGSLHILPGSHTLCHNIKINRNELAARKNSALYFEIDNFYNSMESLSEKKTQPKFWSRCSIS